MTMDKAQQDLLGNRLSADEQEVLELYRRLKALGERKDLPPCITANARQAMVMMWNACVDLDLLYEEPQSD